MMHVCVEKLVDLDTEVRGGLADESERCPNVYSHYDVKSVVWGCVQHLVERESSFTRSVR